MPKHYKTSKHPDTTRRKYFQRYYRTHREHRLKITKNWIAYHPNHESKYRQRNSEHISKIRKRYYRNHKDKELAHNNKYNHDHPEIIEKAKRNRQLKLQKSVRNKN